MVSESYSRPIAIGILIGIATGAITFTLSFIQEQRKRKVEYINRQIEVVYGPLYAGSVANKRAWDDLHKRNAAGRTEYFVGDNPASPEEVEAWRRWMRHVFLPMDVRMEEAIINNSQLLEGGRIYPVFIDFIAHVEENKGIMARWKESDDLTGDAALRRASANTSAVGYPKTLDQCIEDRYLHMLERRAAIENSWLGFSALPEKSFPPDCS